MQPLVSVIVPVYNTEKYLKYCVDSILNQTYKNIEVILVDDGSTDSSAVLCDEYKEIDNRIKVIHKENGGLSSSRKTGVENLTGEYAIIVDSDDWIDDDLIEKCVGVFERNDVDCVLYSYVKEYPNNPIPVSLLKKEGEYSSNFIIRRIIGIVGEELQSPETLDTLTSSCMKMYKTNLLKNAEFFDTKYVGSCEDGLLNIYALKDSSKCFYIDKQFYHYRKHSGETLTTFYRDNFFKKWKNLFFELRNYIQKNNLSGEYIEALDNRIALSMIGLGLNEILNPNRKQIKSSIKAYLNDSEVSSALKVFDISKLPIKWKVFVFCCKHKLIICLITLLKIMNFLKRKGS